MSLKPVLPVFLIVIIFENLNPNLPSSLDFSDAQQHGPIEN